MAIPVGRWVMIASFVAIPVLLINLTIARAAPVHGINTSSLAEASLIEKSVIIHRTPRRYSCWWEGWRRRCGWHG
jgi:hypothetical protein